MFFMAFLWIASGVGLAPVTSQRIGPRTLARAHESSVFPCGLENQGRVETGSGRFDQLT